MKRVAWFLLMAASAAPAVLAAQTAVPTMHVGGRHAGELAAGDRQMRDGRYIDVLQFTGRAGQRVQLKGHASFDISLAIADSTGSFLVDALAEGWDRRDPSIDQVLPHDGRYLISASPDNDPRATGGYQLSLSESGSEAGPHRYTRPANGVPFRATLDAQDRPLGTDTLVKWADTYLIRVRRGGKVGVSLNGLGFAPRLFVQDPDTSRWGTGNEGLASPYVSLRFDAPTSGDYSVTVTSVRPRETGAYNLVVVWSEPGELIIMPMMAGRTPAEMTWSSAPPGVAPTAVSAPASAPAPAAAAPAPAAVAASSGAAPSSAAATPELVTRIHGTLGEGDSVLSSREYGDNYRFQGRSGQRVLLQMRSSNVDSWLYLNGPGGFHEYSNDGGPGTLDARLLVTLPADGQYTVIATTLGGRDDGDYDLEASVPLVGASMPAPAAGASVSPAPPGPSSAPAQYIRTDNTINGSLARGDPQLPAGEYHDDYTFTGRQGLRVTIRMTSDDFDSWLYLDGPDGSRLAFNNNEARDSRHARIGIVLPVDGLYRVIATSLAGRETGRYSLVVYEVQR